MELHQVKYFLAVCEAGNFTRAAAAVSVAQPSLTRAIGKLETEVGGALFLRERRHAVLTSLGRKIKPHLERIAEAEASALDDARGLLTAAEEVVRFGVMSTIAPTRMIGFLARLKQDAPNLNLDLIEAAPKEILSRLQDDRLDAALLALPNLPAALRAIPLYRERYMIAFPSGHRFGEADAVPLDALAGVDYLTRVHCEYMDHLEAHDASRDLGVNVRYSSEREDWVQAMIAAGHGCSIVPEFLPAIEGVQSRPLAGPAIARTVSLATAAGRPHGPALAGLIRLARRHPWPGDGARQE